MKETILRRMVMLTLIAVVLSSVSSVIVVHNFHLNTINDDLRDDAELILSLLDESPQFRELLESKAIAQDGNTRITVVAPSGKVLYDNWANAEQMENHGQRAEIVAAFQEGEGESRRLSSTLGMNTLYYAFLLDSGNVIRFAQETESFFSTLYKMLSLIILLIVVVIIIALWLGDKMAKKIITPINELNLDDPLGNEVYEELSPLLLKIHRQNKDIKKQFTEMEKQQERFQTITKHMVEGLILLDNHARIVYMNSSAFSILGSQGREISEFIGQSLLTLNRDLKIRQVVEQGLRGKIGETLLAIDDKHYELLVSPTTDADGKTNGVIIIVVNVTQKYENERMRKEFSGNVSHELKTPLTAISGYAELLKNGLVKPADVDEFAGRIYDEAKRMSILIDDLMKLSRLDERVELTPRKNVDLFNLAKQVVDRLLPVAQCKNVELGVTGEPVEVLGDAGILFEAVYNLVDNAIKYNRESGGKVEINCRRDVDKVLLEVSDNGVGVPREHHDRIFERFYRVDKSHSRKTGGTGLGLSIVKNAAAYHDATVRFESSENVGTKVTIEF